MCEKDKEILLKVERVEDLQQNQKTCCCGSKMARACLITYLVLLTVLVFALLTAGNPADSELDSTQEPELEIVPVQPSESVQKAAYTFENANPRVQLGIEENDNDVIGSSFLHMEEPSPINPGGIRFAKNAGGDSQIKLENETSTDQPATLIIELETQSTVSSKTDLNVNEQNPTTEVPLTTETPDQEDRKANTGKPEVPEEPSLDAKSSAPESEVQEAKSSVTEGGDQEAKSSVLEGDALEAKSSVQGGIAVAEHKTAVEEELNHTTPETKSTTLQSSPPVTSTPSSTTTKATRTTSPMSWVPIGTFRKSGYIYQQEQSRISSPEYDDEDQPKPLYYYPRTINTNFHLPVFHPSPVESDHHINSQLYSPLHRFVQNLFRKPFFHLPLPRTSLLSSVLRDVHTSHPWPVQVHVEDVPAQPPRTHVVPGPLKLAMNLAGPAGFQARFSSGLHEDGMTGRAKITWG